MVPRFFRSIFSPLRFSWAPLDPSFRFLTWGVPMAVWPNLCLPPPFPRLPIFFFPSPEIARSPPLRLPGSHSRLLVWLPLFILRQSLLPHVGFSLLFGFFPLRPVIRQEFLFARQPLPVFRAFCLIVLNTFFF